MGRYNSSITRVAPVFDCLFKQDAKGRDWLPYLLSIGSRAKKACIPSKPGLLVPDHRRYWGNTERRLAPPQSLLKWLAQNITEEQVERSGDTGPVRSCRLALAQREPSTVAAALKEIESGARTRKWYILEGESAPDAFLETNRIILVVEGKRTESSCTTRTKWMPRRSQLLRHMDAATEVAEDRKVFGLLLVEGSAPDSLQPSEYWRREADSQVESELIAKSLPHRSQSERDLLAQNVLGAATWQRICADWKIAWPPDRGAV